MNKSQIVKLVDRLIADLSDRNGFDSEWAHTAPDTQEEIKKAWHDLIETGLQPIADDSKDKAHLVLLQAECETDLIGVIKSSEDEAQQLIDEHCNEGYDFKCFGPYELGNAPTAEDWIEVVQSACADGITKSYAQYTPEEETSDEEAPVENS